MTWDTGSLVFKKSLVSNSPLQSQSQSDGVRGLPARKACTSHSSQRRNSFLQRASGYLDYCSVVHGL